MAVPTFQVVQDGFPTGKAADPALVQIAQQAIKDGAVRTAPATEDVKKFIGQLRSYLDTLDLKLKTRTSGEKIFWSVTKEKPKRRTENGK